MLNTETKYPYTPLATFDEPNLSYPKKAEGYTLIAYRILFNN